jgi:hypothetical protein
MRFSFRHLFLLNLCLAAACAISSAEAADATDTMKLIQRITRMEAKFEHVLATPSKASIEVQQDLLTESFALLDQATEFLVHNEKLEPVIMESYARLAFLTCANDNSRFCRAHILEAQKKSPEALRAAIQKLAPEQSQFLYEQLRIATEQEALTKSLRKNKK